MFVANLIINGRHVGASDGHTFQRVGRRTGTVVTRAAACDAGAAMAAVDAAAAAFPDWSAADPALRADILTRAIGLFDEKSDQLIDIACHETGAAPEWIRFNITIAQDMLKQAAGLTGLLGEDPSEATAAAPKGMRYSVIRKPAGVVLGIAPWNAPVTLAVRAVAAPLALGNTVVLKASELCPKTHETVADIFAEAGLPAGVLNFITNAPDAASDVVTTLISHPAIRRINFTGSTRVGREVAEIAARHCKRCLLELSGKGTILVLDDADIEAAARAAAHAAFFNQGQICMSADRIVIDERVADDFVTLFRAEAERLRAPQPGSDDGPLGAIISPEAAMRIEGLIDDALSRGADLVTGGEVFGTAMQPTILDRVSYGMRLYDEEAFGPLAGIIRVADAEEAVTIANDTDYGLVAAVFSRDLDRARRIAGQIEAGMVHINGSTVYDDPMMPLGGVKASGYGRFGGRAVVEEFTEIQWITERAEPADILFGQEARAVNAVPREE